MPNWVFNNITVTGDQESLDALATMLNQPYETYHHDFIKDEGMVPATQTFSNPVFAFRNITAPPAEIADEYWALQPKVKSDNNDTKDPNWFADILKASSVSNHWYDWNNRVWGTKWDVGVRDGDTYPETSMDKGDGFIYYRFQTAWSPVIELLVQDLSPKFPTLKFVYEYEEEQGWGGSVVFQNGDILESSEYDIPSSHGDHVDRDMSCICEWEEEQEFWFSDCPNKTLDTAVSSVVQ